MMIETGNWNEHPITPDHLPKNELPQEHYNEIVKRVNDGIMKFWEIPSQQAYVTFEYLNEIKINERPLMDHPGIEQAICKLYKHNGWDVRTKSSFARDDLDGFPVRVFALVFRRGSE